MNLAVGWGIFVLFLAVGSEIFLGMISGKRWFVMSHGKWKIIMLSR